MLHKGMALNSNNFAGSGTGAEEAFGQSGALPPEGSEGSFESFDEENPFASSSLDDPEVGFH